MIRLLLAEDVHLVRGALVTLLDLEEDLEVVSELDNGRAIVDEALRHRPDVAVIDIDLPGLDGLTAAAQLSRRLPSCRTLILTSLAQPGALRTAQEANASGFLTKEAPPAELISAIRQVAQGRHVVDPSLAMAAWPHSANPLTPRELQALCLAARGGGGAGGRHRVSVSSGTVRNYLASAVTKLNARNRLDAVRIAREAGWLLCST